MYVTRKKKNISQAEAIAEDTVKIIVEVSTEKEVTEDKAEVTAEEAEPGLTSSIFPEPSEESVDTENI